MDLDAGVVGARVRAARERQRWNQRTLADSAGLSQATLSRIESGGRLPSMPEMLQLAAALGTSLGDLTGQSAVRARLTCAARSEDDAVAEALRDRMAFYLEMDAQFAAGGHAVTP